MLRLERGVCFEDVVVAIADNRVLDLLEHRNQARYPRQKLLVVRIVDYAYLVPFVEEADGFFFPEDDHSESQGDANLSPTLAVERNLT